ncbi:rCG52527, partial [Rattus norvegicus]
MKTLGMERRGDT